MKVFFPIIHPNGGLEMASMKAYATSARKEGLIATLWNSLFIFQLQHSRA